MKHISKTIILVLSAAAVTVSCQEKELSAGIGQEGIGEYRTFRATTADESDEPSTRTYLGGSSADKSRPVYWNKSDAIFVTDGKIGSEFRVVSESGSTDAIIEGEIPSSDRYSAVYPYRIVKSLRSDGSFDVDFPDWQLCSQDGIYSEYYPMLASCEEGVLRFRNVFGIFVLQLTGDDDDVLNITFEGKNKDGEDLILAGEACIGNPSEPVYEWGSDTQKVVTLDCWHSGKEKLSSEPSSFHIVLPPQEYASFTVTVNMVDGRKMTIHSSKPLTIHRSGYTVASPLHFKADAPEAEYPANCYVVKPGESINIRPVKGNTMTPVGSVGKVGVLWESWGNSFSPKVGSIITSVQYSGTGDDSRISISASKYEEGNAVVAAWDNSGNILWSWHIWITSADLDALAQVYYNGAGTMMDRNLGALSATPGDVRSLGLLYQWGRKDPFMGSCQIDEGVGASSTIEWPSPVSASEYMSGGNMLSFAISHPTTFIYGGNRSITTCDWFSPDSDNYDNSLWTSSKTVYDPCPSGWQIPEGGKNGVWMISSGKSDYLVTGWMSDYFGNNFGNNNNTAFGDDNYIWYPSGGFRHGMSGTFSRVGSRGYYWTCTTDKSNTSCFCCGDPSILIPTVLANGHSEKEIGYRADALSVRCMKDSSKPEIVRLTSISLDQTAIEIPVHSSYALSVNYVPENASDKVVFWSCSNDSIATVNSRGIVTAKSPGSASITIISSDGGFRAECAIRVILNGDSGDGIGNIDYEW